MLAIASTGFLAQAKAIRTALKIADVPIIEYPGVIPVDDDATFASKVEEHVVPPVIGWLEGHIEQTPAAFEQDVQEWEPRQVVMAGDLDDVQTFFLERLWSDGLPIVPPTIDAVDQALSFSARAPDEILGVLPPLMREATVHSVAVNAVMAGCPPELFPVAIAAVECIADRTFRLEDAGSTPGWEPLIILSGPRFAALGLTSGAGQMRVGNRGTASLGRFLRLYMRNVAGLLTPPGSTDKASFGTTFHVALVENVEATNRLGWPTHGVERGFAPSEDVTTVQSVFALSPPIYSGGATARDHMETITHIMASTCGPFAFTGAWFDSWHPLLATSPSVAGAIARDGWTKDDIRRHLFENMLIEARWFDLYARRIRGTEALTLRKLVEMGQLPRLYDESDDPERLVPILRHPESTGIVLAGDPGRNQSRVYVNCHQQGVPVSRAVSWL